MNLNNLNISKKLTVAFAVVVTAVAIMSVAVCATMLHIKDVAALNAMSVQQLRAADDVMMNLVERQNNVRAFVASGDERFAKKAETFEQAYQAALDKWLAMSPEDAAQINA